MDILEGLIRLAKCTVLGGLALFLWGMVSWMVLPGHQATLCKFSDERAVAKVLVENSCWPGLYILPNAHGANDPIQKLGAEEDKALMKRSYEQMEKGPFAFVAFKPNGAGPMKKQMLRGFLIQMLGAFLVTLLVARTAIENYFVRVTFIVTFAAAAGVVCHLPQWNWWGFPSNYTLMEFSDLIIGWFFAGLVIAKIISKPIR